MKKIILCASLSLIALSACSRLPQKYQVIHNSTNDYQGAAALPPIVIPPGYSSSGFQERYVVPNPQLAKSIQPVSLMPPDMGQQGNVQGTHKTHWWSF